MFCRNCGTPITPGSAICNNCGVPSGEGNHFCQSCGNQVNGTGSFCSKCGKPLDLQASQPNQAPNNGYQPPNNGGYQAPNNGGYQAPPYAQNGYNQGYPPPFLPQQKSRMVAGILAIFLGTLGVHNFYLGYTKKAITQIVISILGGIVTCGIATAAVSIWALIEAVQIFIGNIPTDADGVPLRD